MTQGWPPTATVARAKAASAIDIARVLGRAATIARGRSDNPEYILETPGLVTFFEMDNTSGPVVDITGGNDGVASGGVTRGETGKVDNAFLFDGVDGAVTFPTTGLNFSVGSLEFWIKKSASWCVGAEELLIQLGLGSAYYPSADNFYMSIHPAVGLHVRRGAGGISYLSYACGNFTTGVWYHVVFTWGTAGGHLYVDAIDRHTRDLDDAGTVSASGYIGRETNVRNEFAGHIDHVSFYDRELTQGEVTDHYQLGGNVYPPTATIRIIVPTWPAYYNLIIATPGLHAFWPLDELTGTVAEDVGPSGYDGVYTNSPILGQAGKIHRATAFAGSTNFIDLPDAFVDALSDITLEAWVYWYGTGALWQRIFEIARNTTEYFFVTPNGGAGVLGLGAAITIGGAAGEQRLSTGTNLASGAWKYVVVTLKDDLGTLYLDGAPILTNPAMTVDPSDLATTVSNFIARSVFTADPRFEGKIDSPAVYSRALTAPEVLAHYNAGIATP